MYPDFVTVPFSFHVDMVLKLKPGSLRQIIRVVLSIGARYYYPRLAAKILYLPSIFLFSYRFLALNLDHFGPMKYLYYFVNSSRYCSQKSYLVLQYTDDINRVYRLSLPKNIVFVKNPLLWALLSGFFFIPRVREKIFPDFDLVSAGLVEDECKDSNFHSDPRSFALIPIYNYNYKALSSYHRITYKRKYVVFYARTPGYRYTVGRSFRNIDIDNFKVLARELTNRGIMVVRMGSEFMPVANWELGELFFDYPHYKEGSEELDALLWRGASAVVGSGSGGADVPCAYFGIPQLYITSFMYLSRLFSYHGLDTKEGAFPKNAVWLLPTIRWPCGTNIPPGERLSLEAEKLEHYEGGTFTPFTDIEIAAAGLEFLDFIGLLELNQHSRMFQRYRFATKLLSGPTVTREIVLDEIGGTVWSIQ